MYYIKLLIIALLLSSCSSTKETASVSSSGLSPLDQSDSERNRYVIDYFRERIPEPPGLRLVPGEQEESDRYFEYPNFTVVIDENLLEKTGNIYIKSHAWMIITIPEVGIEKLIEMMGYEIPS